MTMCSERYAVNLQENTHAWQLYRNHTLALVFFWEFAAYFGIPYHRNTSTGAALVVLNSQIKTTKLKL